MVTEGQERFIHLATCISRLHSALETLRAIKAESPDNRLIGPAFRFAIVEYVSLFTRSIGQLDDYKLDERHVPKEHLDLHKRLVSARHRVHAHFDLTLLNPTFQATGTRDDPAALVSGTHVDELKELPNISQIISLVEQSIHSMYDERRTLLQALNS